MVWTHDYNPTGSEVLSTLLAAAPIVVLLGTLGLLSWSAPRAAAAGLVTALAISVGIYGMPWQSAVAASAYGAAFGLFPIGWIVLMAVFLYVLSVETGEFEKIKHSVMALSPDRRVQALLIAFSFGAFMEGVAGFGTPVAISAALLIGAGFPPLYAAGLSLIANTAPVAFGALGTPIITLGKVTGLDEYQLSAMAGRQLPFFSLVVPGWMVWIMSGWRGVKGVFPAIVVCGGVFGLLQFSIANYVGPYLVDIVAGLGSLVALALMLRFFWQPCQLWAFQGEAEQDAAAVGEKTTAVSYTRREIISAWMPWVILSLCVFAWGLPQFRTILNGGVPPSAESNEPPSWWQRPNALAGKTVLDWQVPYLHKRVQSDPETLPDEAEPKEAKFTFNWLSATGTSIFVASILAAAWMRVSPAQYLRLLFHTIHRLRWSLFTISTMMAIAYLTKYSGSDVTLGLAFTRTGVLYPFFAAMLGWLGVALTGSDTSSNALFGNLQRITAERLGLNPILIATANSTGGVMGKMIDAQSIVVASAATGQHGTEGQILRFVFWSSVSLAALMGLLTMLQATVLSWMVP